MPTLLDALLGRKPIEHARLPPADLEKEVARLAKALFKLKPNDASRSKLEAQHDSVDQMLSIKLALLDAADETACKGDVGTYEAWCRTRKLEILLATQARIAQVPALTLKLKKCARKTRTGTCRCVRR